jgi:hypothetical protein
VLNWCSGRSKRRVEQRASCCRVDSAHVWVQIIIIATIITTLTKTCIRLDDAIVVLSLARTLRDDADGLCDMLQKGSAIKPKERGKVC